jgi:hypothetical protein
MHPAFDAIVDYAGLFPPASCSMDEAVANFAAYRAGPDRAMLGRFVVAASRLREFGETVTMQGRFPGREAPWPLSVVFGANHPDELSRIADFEAAFELHGLAVEAIEARVATPGEISMVVERLPSEWEWYFELPHVDDYDALVQEIKLTGGAAKIRTGGTTPETFPTPGQLARFLAAVTRHGVPFKATAGLHHPWRGMYPLTYAADSAQYLMYGFMNVLFATALLQRGGDLETAQAVLEESDPGAFARGAGAITWRGHRMSLEMLATARADGFRGFGSCSFREPVDGLHAAVAS